MVVDFLPHFNAAVNFLSFICLIAGFVAIRKGRRDSHKKIMLTAVGLSVLFLVGYLLRVTLGGTHRFPDMGLIKTVYLIILFSHMILATVLVPLVIRLLYLAFKEGFEKHRRLARYVWPIWLYSSATGVIVYYMLYHLAPGLAA